MLQLLHISSSVQFFFLLVTLTPFFVKFVIIKGLGLTDPDSDESFPDTLQQKSVRYVDIDDCKEAWANDGFISREKMVCAQAEDGIDACGGDSGGPLFYKDYDSGDGLPKGLLVGIHSFGAGCADNLSNDLPSGYARVYDAVSIQLRGLS